MITGLFPITSKRMQAADVVDFTLHCPEVAATAQSGQFVHIKVGGFTLRRPISICEIDRQAGTVRLVIQVRGNGTAEISRLNQGDYIDMIAPLGQGWNPIQGSTMVIGGGIGSPPLLQLCKELDNPVVILGFRDKDSIILEDDFAEVSDLHICTDDGSYGFCGYVTERFKQLSADNPPEKVYACGPEGMLRAVAAICRGNAIDCEVSLEERMACGVGACLVCSCKAVKDGKEYYARICKDGPVMAIEN
ncbi:MAG: dihydroorotate dehydrogenase electron transfer subunit [Oscillospiraceae bacterium]|nr:dihydroorotate dehydrogenase electron transfer subunit [Oscillospiraceae bacterium]